MRILRNILSQLHTFVLWLLFCFLFWSWIYVNYLNDTDKEHKVMLYTDVYVVYSRPLTLRLEENLPEGLKMIKVSDVTFSGTIASSAGDLYIIGQTKLQQLMEEYPDSLTPIPAMDSYAVPEGLEVFTFDGKCYGIRVYDPETKIGVGRSYIGYAKPDTDSDEPFYLCFDAKSVHLEWLDGAVDNAAWEVAMDFLTLTG